MVCYSPIRAFRKSTTKGSEIYFNIPVNEHNKYIKMDLACGRCIGCKIEKSREWAIRCMHESSLYEYNCYLTLTIDDEHLNESGTLEKKDFQNFMKELRRKYVGKTRNNGNNMPETIEKIRFFHCGEYGTACRNCGYVQGECYCGDYEPGIGRPHHHVLLFNFDFPDKVLETTKEGINHYSSEILQKLWRKGIHDIGEITFQSAAYVARYTIKKVTGKKAEHHYQRYDNRSNRVYKVEPEYITMSRRPGIGKEWFDKYKYTDCYSKDCISEDGKTIKVPRYYDRMLEEIDEELYKTVKRERRSKAIDFEDDRTLRRLSTRRMIKEKQVSLLERSL